jgi:alpha-2,3 sialyltransferase
VNVQAKSNKFVESDATVRLREKINRPLLLVCNGPSMIDIDYKRIPKDPVIIRVNHFYLENDYYFGKHVDAFFWSIYHEILQDNLFFIINEGLYAIDTFFCPMPLINKEKKERNTIDSAQDKLFQPRHDHWRIIASEPSLSRLMMSRPMPTTGLQALATALILGFKKIHIIGMDFYQASNNRYAFDIPTEIRKRISAKHYNLGYESKVHNLKTDLKALKMIQSIFSSAKIYSLSKKSYLANLVEISPKTNTTDYLFKRKENANQKFSTIMPNTTGLSVLKPKILKTINLMLGSAKPQE